MTTAERLARVPTATLLQFAAMIDKAEYPGYVQWLTLLAFTNNRFDDDYWQRPDYRFMERP